MQQATERVRTLATEGRHLGGNASASCGVAIALALRMTLLLSWRGECGRYSVAGCPVTIVKSTCVGYCKACLFCWRESF